jgi:hypothetical protein
LFRPRAGPTAEVILAFREYDLYAAFGEYRCRRDARQSAARNDGGLRRRNARVFAVPGQKQSLHVD